MARLLRIILYSRVRDCMSTEQESNERCERIEHDGGNKNLFTEDDSCADVHCFDLHSKTRLDRPANRFRVSRVPVAVDAPDSRMRPNPAPCSRSS